MKTAELKSFHYLENGEISYSYMNTLKTCEKLDGGSYKVDYLDYPTNKVTLKKDPDIETSKSHTFPEKEEIDAFINSFFSDDVMEMVKNFGFYHKAGLLFHGKEGTGKTSIMKHYYNRLIEENDAIVVHMMCTNYRFKDCWDFIMGLRKVQDNPIIIVMDEFDEYLKENESFLKKAIDGNLSIDKSLFMASTNHLDKIPDAMKKRKSRFKYVVDIGGVSSEDEVTSILTKLLGSIFSKDEIEAFVQELKGQTLDEIKQFALDRVMKIQTSKPVKKSIGFK